MGHQQGDIRDALETIETVEARRVPRLFRYLLTRLSAAALLLAACLGAWAEAPRPNIIHILADDMGYGDAGFNGQRRIKTPNLDRLAREGMVFRQHYAGCTVCSPSRACLMTGMHTGRVTVDRNAAELSMPADEVTVAEVLRDAGYRCHFIGKWGLGGGDMSDDLWTAQLGWQTGTGALIPGQEPSLPTRQGFDTSLAYLNQLYAHLYYPVALWRNETRERIPGNQSPVYDERAVYSHDLLEAETLRLIQEADGSRPFYIQCSYTLPHRETKAPKGYEPYADRDWPEVEKAYAVMITRLDDTVGAVLDAVDGTPPVAANTLIIFTSDNGPQSTDGHSPFFFDSNGPLRGSKRDLYEGGIRAPTAMRWKGVVAEGSATGHCSAFWDFLPTCAELAGAKAPEGLDGISFVPTLTGKGEQREHDFLFWSFHEHGAGPTKDGGREPVQRFAVRRGDWKLVVLRDGRRELYNLAEDIGETTNVAEQHPDVTAALHAIALREEARGPDGGRD